VSATAAIAVVLGLGLGTLAFRLVFAELRHRCAFPPWLESALDWVPVVLLAALVAPALIPAADSGSPAPALGAGLVTIVTTYRSRSLLLAVCLGMGTFWALGAFF